AEFQWIHLDGVSELVHVALAREMVGRGRQSAVGALPQRRFAGMLLLLFAANLVGSLKSRGARVVVVELPLRDGPVGVEPGTRVDHATRTEVGPGHFFFTRPVALHRLAGRLGQAG